MDYSKKYLKLSGGAGAGENKEEEQKAREEAKHVLQNAYKASEKLLEQLLQKEKDYIDSRAALYRTYNTILIFGTAEYDMYNKCNKLYDEYSKSAKMLHESYTTHILEKPMTYDQFIKIFEKKHI